MLVFCVNLNAQVDKYLNSQLLVAQKEGSEQAVCDYFSDIGSDADYLYVLMYIPGRSPRMETYIKMFDRDLSAVDSSAVEEFNGNAEHDVFMDEYYDGFTPVMSCVDIESGKEVGKFGTLPEYSRRTRTGYYFSNSFSADSYGDEFIYSTGSDGLIHLCDVSSFEKDKTAYEIFRPDISSFTEIDDKMFYSTDYAFIYMPYFQRCIKDLRLTHDKIHALVRIRLSSDYNDDSFAYEYYVLDRATGKVETNYVLKPDNENEKVLGWAFTSDPDNVRVFYLAECDNGYSVSFISLK